MAAGVIIETPPGGNRGSTAVLVEFLLLEPPVIELLAVLVPEADPEPEAEADPDPEADPEADALSLLFSSLLPSELCVADADADADISLVCDADADCAIPLVSTPSGRRKP